MCVYKLYIITIKRFFLPESGNSHFKFERFIVDEDSCSAESRDSETKDSDLESSANPESGSESTIDQNHQTMD